MSQGMWDLKKLMFLVQGSLCFYCWKPMSQEKEHLKANHYATKDHLVPVSAGGAADWTNTILACLACNRVKSNRMPTEAEIARHGHLYALFNERVEMRREEIAAKEARKAANGASPAVQSPAPEPANVTEAVMDHAVVESPHASGNGSEAPAKTPMAAPMEASVEGKDLAQPAVEPLNATEAAMAHMEVVAPSVPPPVSASLTPDA